ncbi:MAG: hypothetical protein H6658_20380 [Ardenticatenaceae bacterium]|nr:hypothetical protein [Ardenticatenaceae bacterium]
MMMMNLGRAFLIKLLTVCSVVLLLMGCGEASPSAVTPSPMATAIAPTTSSVEENTVSSETDTGYPAADNRLPPGYVAPESTIEGLSPTVPDPDVILPETDSNTAAIGGVLAREITDQGYVPVQPRALILGRIIENDRGEQALISVSENAQRAELFATGVFLFSQVPPGDYGLVIDLGFTEFPLTDENGDQILLSIEGGTAVDLGQIIVRIPED